MKNLSVRPEERVRDKKIQEILFEEWDRERKYLWGGKIPVTEIANPRQVTERVQQARLEQYRRDPRSHLPRTARLENAKRYFDTWMASLRRQRPQGPAVEITDLRSFFVHMKPVLYAIMEDEVAERLDTLSAEAVEAFRKTSAAYRELVGSAHATF